MNKCHRTLLALFAVTVFIILGAGQGLSANTYKGISPDGLHRDGSAFARENRITQADRQAVADRVKAKSLETKKAGNSAAPNKTIPTDGGRRNEK